MVISRLYNIVRKNVNDMNMAIDIKLFFRRLAVFLGLFCMLAAWCPATAKAAGRVSGLRIGQGIGSVRIVFDADAEFDYNVFLLNYPKRLVVDTKNVYIGKALEKTRDKNNLVSRVRVGDIRDGKTRVVFDLLKPVVVKRVFMFLVSWLCVCLTGAQPYSIQSIGLAEGLSNNYVLGITQDKQGLSLLRARFRQDFRVIVHTT